jgi:hypothetical protein
MHRLHRLLSRAWMRPVRIIGWWRVLPARVEAHCQRRSAHHMLRALGRTPEDLRASLMRKRRGGNAPP